MANRETVVHAGGLTIATLHASLPSQVGWTETSVRNSAGGIVAIITHPAKGAPWWLHPAEGAKVRFATRKAALARAVELAGPQPDGPGRYRVRLCVVGGGWPAHECDVTARDHAHAMDDAGPITGLRAGQWVRVGAVKLGAV